MRDPDRIPGVLAKIQEIWERFPDLRLGQLLENISCGQSIYYMEDDYLLDRLDYLYNKGVINDEED